MIRDRIKSNYILYHILLPIVNFFRRVTNIYLRTIVFFVLYGLRRMHVLSKDAKIEDLKDKYVGKDIFIVATGPSLSVEDLDWLQNNDEISIGVNGIFKLYGETDWRPTYYALDDVYLYKKYKADLGGINVDEVAKELAIFSEPVRKELTKNQRKCVGFIPICYYDHWFTHYSKIFRYNSDIVMGHFDAYTVTNFAINLADYMGANRIILMGVDCDYFQDKMHAGEKTGAHDDMDAKKLYDAQVSGYKFVNQVLNGKRTRVLNATRGGKLEVFPRISMEYIKENK